MHFNGSCFKCSFAWNSRTCVPSVLIEKKSLAKAGRETDESVESACFVKIILKLLIKKRERSFLRAVYQQVMLPMYSDSDYTDYKTLLYVFGQTFDANWLFETQNF